MNTTDERDWKTELTEQRASEWTARCALLKLAGQIVEMMEKEGLDKATPELAIKCFEASSKLGRLAVGGVEAAPGTLSVDRDFLGEMNKALDRIEQTKTTHETL